MRPGPPMNSSPPIGGPIVTPKFAATRTDAYAASCRSGATRSAIIAWSAAPPSDPNAGSPASSARPRYTWWPTKSSPSGRGAPPPPDQDQRPAADLVRPVAADIPGDDGEDRADEVGEREPRLAGVQVLDRPDPQEDEDRRAGDRAGEADGEDRAQRTVDVAAPDESEQAGEHPPEAKWTGSSRTSVPSEPMRTAR